MEDADRPLPVDDVDNGFAIHPDGQFRIAVGIEIPRPTDQPNQSWSSALSSTLGPPCHQNWSGFSAVADNPPADP